MTHEALKAFYQEHAPEKMMEMDDAKLQSILDKVRRTCPPLRGADKSRGKAIVSSKWW